jgi:hypothetical protein
MLVSGYSMPYSFYKAGYTMEAAGVIHSFLLTSGYPAMRSPLNAPGVAGTAVSGISPYFGFFPYVNAPANKYTYLARLSYSANIIGTLQLCDLLWENTGINVTTTTLQQIGSVQWPSRCPNASGAYVADTSGYGIQAAILVTTTTTNAGAIANTTMSYTNTLGVTGRTARISNFPTTAISGSFVPFYLESGDNGIQSIQNITLGTSYGGGAIRLVAYRPIAVVHQPVAYGGGIIDPITGGLPVLYDYSALFFNFLPSATTATNIIGTLQYAYG